MRALLPLVLAIPTWAFAQGLLPEQLPKPLQDWLPWAWQGHEAERCPPSQSDAAARHCLWPGALALNADARGARFRYEITVYGGQALRAALPGEPGQWPQALTLDGKPAAATEHEGRPSLLLGPGRHRIEGAFSWNALPPDLALPAGIASLQLTVDGKPRAALRGDDGRLPLGAEAAATAPEGDALQLQVVRRIADGVPARLSTRWQLVVSGQPREVRLPAALLEGWQPTALDSPLPARLAADGSLQLQARPGSWTLQLDARQLAPLQALSLPTLEGLGEEVWLFAADAPLRALTPSGGTSLDPRQVPMPDDWRSLPAWRVRPGEAMRFAETRRGSAEAAADALQLQRTVWLDFDGRGYTVQDRLSGSFNRSTRATLAAPLQLGRAAVDGEDQALTQLPGERGRGIELRRQQALVQADSRLDEATRSLPASGWQLGLNSVALQLNLPPGWQLLHAGGPDEVRGSWASRWTLWDAFFLLLAALGAGRLMGWRAGLVLGAALLAGLQLNDAPSTAWWLILLALIALARLLPAHPRAQAVLRSARGAIALLLGLLLLGFAVQQVRLALHPVLELQGMRHVEKVEGPVETRTVELQAPPMADLQREPAPRALKPYAASSGERIERSDPNARVQTGPGLPHWRGQEHHLRWQGPVAADQPLRLWLLPPWATALWRVAAVLLLAAALVRLLREGSSGGGATLAALIAGLGLSAAATAATAPPAPAPGLAWPTAEQLTELRQRSNPPPACLPRCAEFARAQLTASGSTVQLRLELQAQAEVAVPLPGSGSAWAPTRVLLNGEPAPTRRDERGQLWGVAPVGVSQWLFETDIGSAAQVEIALPLPLRALQTQLSGWQLGGLDARGLPGGALQLSRAAQAQSAAEERATPRDALAPLARITRTLVLGLQWQMETTIERLDPSRAPLTLRWALLNGEQVTDPAVQVTDADGGKVATLQLGAAEGASVSSRLSPQAELRWLARPEPHQVERWQLQAAPMWRAAWNPGIAPLAHHAQGGEWAPVWQPWPGERLTLKLQRPPGAQGGQTLTLDSVTTQLQPGAQSLQATQTLVLRSSLGGEHRLQLPPGAELQALTVNGVALPPQAPQGVVKLALTPGSQTVEMRWRAPEGLGFFLRTPQLGLNAPAVNDVLTLQLPDNRLLLLAGGPLLGPAVLFWGVLAVVAAGALLLGRLLGWRVGLAALLLGIGMAPTSLNGFGLVAAWFALLVARARLAPQLGRFAHNGLQVLLVVASACALVALLEALRVGLLGYPDLLVAGNGSTAQQLHWMADRVSGATSSAWLLTLPMWLYRVLMLIWALWLAHALLGWLRWAWGAASRGGLWRAAPPKAQPVEDAQP